jgi:hypothetical protein
MSRGQRRIEWVGEQSPLDEPFVQFNLAAGNYTREQEAILRRAAVLAHLRREHITERVLTTDDPGLSEDVRFGPYPGTFVRTVSNADADKILSCSDGHEFRDLDAMEPDEPTIVHPPLMVKLVSASILDWRGQERAANPHAFTTPAGF